MNLPIQAMRAPILVFGWGNPARGDDALGLLFVERIEALGLSGVDCLQDDQLQIEHALDLAERKRILFVDASRSLAAPFAISRLAAAQDPAQVFTHALAPQALLRVFEDFHAVLPPPSYLLEIRGENFSLGAPCSAAGLRHLTTALEWAKKWLK
ncbi:MAG: hydrogenase maturation protease [Rhodocyclaceae bacterium]